MPAGSALLEIRNLTDPNLCFYGISKSCGIMYYYLLQHTAEWAMSRADFTVDVKALRNVLKQIVG